MSRHSSQSPDASEKPRATSGASRQSIIPAVITFGGICLLVGVAAGLTARWIAHRERPLTERAQRLLTLRYDPTLVNSHCICWMSPDRLLVLTAEHGATNGLWKAQATLVSLSSGRSTPLPKLAELFRKRGDLPDDCVASPDATRLLLISRNRGDNSRMVSVSTLDGVEGRSWDDDFQHLSGWLDRTHYIVDDGKRVVHVYDLVAAERDRTPGRSSKEGIALIDKLLHLSAPPVLISGFDEEPPNVKRLTVIESGTPEHPLHIRTGRVQFSAASDVIGTAVSPDQGRVLYAVNEEQPVPRLLLALHRLAHVVPLPARFVQSLWISDADGSHLRQLGLQRSSTGFAELGDLDWAPDGGHIRFMLDRVLYALPVPPPAPARPTPAGLGAANAPAAEPILQNASIFQSEAEAEDAAVALGIAASRGDLVTVRRLLKRRVDTEGGVGDEGQTPLARAAAHGHTEIVRRLLLHGANVDATYGEGRTALFDAIASGSLACTRLLVYHGADVNKDARFETPLTCAIRSRRVTLVRLVLDNGADVNIGGAYAAPLEEAAEAGNAAIVRLLLKRGAAVDHGTRWGRTPLMKAAAAGNLAVARTLIAHGANVNAVGTLPMEGSRRRESPLAWAVTRRKPRMVRLLRAVGARR